MRHWLLFLAASGTFVRLAATGATDAAFAQNVGAAANVFPIKGFANGQYLLGSLGGTLLAGGLARTEVLRLNADGTADATFNAGTGPAMTNDTSLGYDYAPQPNGKVLVVGYFDSFGGNTANGVVPRPRLRSRQKGCRPVCTCCACSTAWAPPRAA